MLVAAQGTAVAAAAPTTSASLQAGRRSRRSHWWCWHGAAQAAPVLSHFGQVTEAMKLLDLVLLSLLLGVQKYLDFLFA